MKRDYNNRYNEDRQMYPATCSNCGKACEVPFQPTGTKPVLCSECFGKQKDSQGPSVRRYGDAEKRYGRGRNFDRRDDRRGDRGERSHGNPGLSMQMELLNTKLDKIIALLSPKD